MKRILWVVEILISGNWEPTVGAYLSRADARAAKHFEWEVHNRGDKFRIKKYVGA